MSLQGSARWHTLGNTVQAPHLRFPVTADKDDPSTGDVTIPSRVDRARRPSSKRATAPASAAVDAANNP
jgi:hypothetical protein